MSAAAQRGRERLRKEEIEPGRIVPNDWEKWLVEPWAERKARRARERAAAAQASAVRP